MIEFRIFKTKRRKRFKIFFYQSEPAEYWVIKINCLSKDRFGARMVALGKQTVVDTSL